MVLPTSFYQRETLKVAPELLGEKIVRRTGDGLMSGLITEVEAYTENDPASHSCRGKTPRNKVMYGPPGHAYVYFCYGNHWLLNLVTEEEGTAGAVLIRALRPQQGVELMKKNRDREDHLTDGPGKLTQALQITGQENGVDVTKGDLRVEKGVEVKPGKIRTGPRIGIKEGTKKEWRFFVREEDLD